MVVTIVQNHFEMQSLFSNTQYARIVLNEGLQLRSLANIFSFSRILPKMGPLESAKKVAAYKAVDEYVKVISILNKLN